MIPFLCALLLLQSEPPATPPAAPPSSRDRGSGRGRTTVDVATARQRLMEKDPPQERDFDALVQSAYTESTNRKLPSYFEDPEATYGPEHVAFRAEVYGPLLADPKLREFLRSIVRKPSTRGFGGSTAAVVLADAPDEADLAALLAGYDASTPEQLASIARQLGRAVAALRKAEPRPALADEAFARLRTDATEGKAAQRGAAIEGLFRAGDDEAAIQVVEPLLAEGSDPAEAMPVLQACARLFRRPNVDPFMKARAVAMAEAQVAKSVASSEELAISVVLSSEGKTLRSAVAFLQDVGDGTDFGLLMRCLESRRAQRLLGMDGLQDLRYGLQRRRGRLPPADAAALDEHWLRPLLAAGERLFALEEEPMDAEEKRAFWEQRDLRYNALAYFCDQFQRTPASPDSPPVKERLGREPDLPAYLAAIYRAAADETVEMTGASEEGAEGGGASSSRFNAVAEKIENRVLALQLLALVQREWNRDPGGLDLFAEAYSVLAAEINAPIATIESVVAFRHSDDPDRTVDIPILRPPSDAFVQGAAIQTIANLGHVVHTTPTSIRIELDHEYPWPWPATAR